MENRGPFNGSASTRILQTENLPPTSFWISGSSSAFQGCSSMVNFENSSKQNEDVKPYFSPVLDNEENNTEDETDPLFHHESKKRRLSTTQVKFLEKNFEVENRLAPDRKLQLATEIGLQPRQVAIWFQNRRARSKNKKLEKDYAVLKTSLDQLKVEYDSLLKQHQSLIKEVDLLRKELAVKENSEELPSEVDKKNIIAVNFKIEEMNSAKSDVIDSESIESPYHTNMKYSTNSFEIDHSDFSQDEEDSFIHFPCLPKIEDGCYNYPYETENSIWLWP